MRLLFVIVYSIINQLLVIGQYVELVDSRSLSLAGTINATGESYMGISNPAGLIGNTTIQVGMHYNNRFTLHELGVQGFAMAVPVWRGSFAGRISYFGSRDLNQSMFVISYGHDISSWLAAGIDLNYYLESIEALHQRRSAITGNLGVIVQPMNELTIGVYYKNLTRSAYNFQTGNETGTSLQMGISYIETEKFLFAGMLNWTEYRWVDIALGSEVFLNKRLAIRGGIKLPSSMTYSFGTGIFFTGVDFNLGFEQHPVLGLSSSVSVVIQIKRNGKR